MTTEVSRETLYQAVWEKPATYVAKEYGISGVALGKICRRNNIPVPSRGYWSRLKVGKEVEGIPVLPSPNNSSSTIVIKGTRPTLRIPSVEVAIGKIEEKLIDKRLAVAAADKTEAVSTPYGMKLEKSLGRGRPSADGQITVHSRAQFRVEVSSNMATRAVDIVNRLVFLATAAELKLQPTENGVGFLCNGEIVSIEIIEKRDRRPHVLSDKESRELDRWNKETTRTSEGGSLVADWDKPQIAKWDYAPSGRLEIRIDGAAANDGLRRRFNDGSAQRVEELLREVILGVAACSAAAKIRREERARREQEMREARAERTEIERNRALEAKRADFLSKVLTDWKKANALDEFLEDFHRRYRGQVLPEPVQKFLDWSSSFAKELRQRQTAEALFAVLQDYPLMDDSMDVTGWLRRMP